MQADQRVKSFIDRILRLKEEQDTLADDIREVYAEAKGEGYDKTAMGALVAHLRKIEKKGADAVSEADSVFAIYLEAYERATGTPIATHTHEEFPPHDPETGELTDSQEHETEVTRSRPEAVANSAADIDTPATGNDFADDVGATASSTNSNGLAGPACAHDDEAANTKPAPNANSSEPLRSDKAETLPSSREVSATNPDLRPRSQAAASPASDAAPSEAGATTAAASRSSSMTAREIDATIPAFLRRTEGAYPKREVEGV